MNTLHKTIATLLLFTLALQQKSFAEGVKELLNSVCTNFGFIQIWDNNDPLRDFATYNCTPDHRLYIRVKNTEKIYFGYSIDPGFTQDVWYRLKDPSGTVVMGPTKITSVSANGWITACSKAIIGPLTLFAGGYQNLTYTATTSGDYYIEFAVNNDATQKLKRVFNNFDITVATAGGVVKKGRVWSKAWDLNTMAGNNPFVAKLYAYSNDSMVTRINFNGIRPFGFVISCNSFGASNVGSIQHKRKSNYRQSIINEGGIPGVPEFRLFLNDPDTNEFPTGKLGKLNSVSLMSCVQPSNCITVNVSKPGQIEAKLIFPSNGSSVTIIQNASSGDNCLSWNGKDGLGNVVPIDSIIKINVKYAQGLTHLPMTDAEIHLNGYIVDAIRPATDGLGNPIPAPKVYWDDSLLTDPINSLDGISNLGGCSGGCHTWQNRGTNNLNPEVINTWWYFKEEIDTLTATCITVMPIELVGLTAKQENEKIKISWATASENNNDYFLVEKSIDAKFFEALSIVEGAGNSTIVKYYDTYDHNPIYGVAYYRLKQVDYNGQINYSKIVSVKFDFFEPNKFDVLSNPCNGIMSVGTKECQRKEVLVVLYDMMGNRVYSKVTLQDSGKYSFIALDTSSKLPSGVYLVIGSSENEMYNQKLVINENSSNECIFMLACNH